MKLHPKLLKTALVAAFSSALLLGALPASAHCDGLDGPVVTAARQALEAGDVNRVLIWVKPADEATVREAFRKTAEVRRLSPTAKEVADTAFYETVVRVHRMAEGEPFTGLKPAGRDLGPAIPAADKALQTGELKPLTDIATRSLTEKFRRVRALASYPKNDVEAGRRYVAAYVEYVHAAEAIGGGAHAAEEASTAGEPHGH